MYILSWNVLLREYEEKYNPCSDILKTYPVELDRLHDIIKIIKNSISNETVVCLQECSSELINMLKETFRSFTIHNKKIGENDYLVTMIPARVNSSIEEIETGIPHSQLIVKTNRFRIINCHLIPQKHCEIPILESLYRFCKEESTKINIVAGDFNENFKTVQHEFGNEYIVPYFGKTYRYKQIDYILIETKNKNILHIPFLINSVRVSDHQPIKLIVTL